MDEPLVKTEDESQETIHHRQKGTGVPSQLSLRICATYGCTMIYAARTVIPLVVQDMAEDLGWNSVLVGYVLSFFFWGYAVTQVIGGYWADRIGGARVVVITSLMGSISIIFLPQVVAIWAPGAALLRFFLGAVQGPHYPSLNSLASQIVPPAHRARFLSSAFTGSPLGSIIVGLAGSIALEKFGWQLTVTIVGCLYASAAIWLYWLTKKSPHPSDTRASPSASVPWRALLRNHFVWIALIVHTTHTVSWFLLISWLPSYFKQTHPSAKGWIVNTLPFLMAAAGTAVSTHLAESLLHQWKFSVTSTRKIIELISQLTAACAMFLLPFCTSVWSASFFTSLCAGFVSLHANGGLQLPQDFCPQHAGSVFGIINTGGALAGFVSNLAAGYLLSANGGDYGPVFQMAGGLAASGAIIFAVFGSAEPLNL